MCFLGCRGVGKTTIIERFALGQIDDERLAQVSKRIVASSFVSNDAIAQQNEPTIEDIYERSVVRGDTLAIIHLMDSPGAVSRIDRIILKMVVFHLSPFIV